MMMKESCIISRISQGESPQPSTKSFASARPAPSPSKTALKQSAARMIQRNMALIERVWRTTDSSIFHPRWPRHQAASVAASAPTALDSVRLVMPMRKSPVIEKKMTKGRTPARSSRSFSESGTLRSSGGSAGPRWGCSRQRM